MNKLAIIVPYRDRPAHLLTFKQSIVSYLKDKDIDYELIIVEQDEAKTFNRGKLLNVGFFYAKKLKCDYVVFHDVDMIPLEVDYSYSPKPIHLASNFVSTSDEFNRILWDEYFGGVTMFPSSIFEAINGYSNEYWGWGYEDDDLLFRCKRFNVDLDTKELDVAGSNTAALKFNGHNSFIEFKNVIEPIGDYTIFISFFPDELRCNPDGYDDTFPIFTIPGTTPDCDLSINFNSYLRYNFEIYDEEEKLFYINSDIKPTYKTNICVTINAEAKEIQMFQDGILIGKEKVPNGFYNYRRQHKMYLGVNDPKKEEGIKFFKGLINQFAIYSTILSDEEILEISTNKYFGLTQNYDNYNSAEFLKVCYDAKVLKGYELVDLASNRNNGKITNCEMTGYSIKDKKTIYVPHRRESTFKLIPHEENGFVNGSWKNITTRYNQLKYFNEIAPGYRNEKEDGLSNCTFKELSRTNINNQTHILVSI